MSEPSGGGQARHLRPLLPTTTRAPPQRPARILDLPPRRTWVTAACETCREHKTKCSGEKPACRRCLQRHRKCVYAAPRVDAAAQALKKNYDALRDRVVAQEEVLSLLRDLPEQQAQHVLQRIRSGADNDTIIKQVKAGNLLLQLAVLPETQFRYEFPYRKGMPPDHVADNPYLESLIFGAATLYTPDQFPKFSSRKLHETICEFSRGGYESRYLKPFHAAEVVSPWLSDLRPSLWTSVSDDDVLMRELLGVFFRCEYQFTAVFQKDYFLEDMVMQRQDFCSSLLVNIVLAYSSVCYPLFPKRAEYWNTYTLTYRFLAEARRLWELEASEPRLTTIQSGILLNVFYNLSGLDQIGQAYRIRSVALAQKIRLFDGSARVQSSRVRNGQLFTAWALYSWESLVAFSFMHPPLVLAPPVDPLPDPSEDAEWYGEIWLKYPLSQNYSSSNFSHMFKARCDFRLIMNKFSYQAYSKEGGLTLDEANELYSQLKSWYDALPGPLLPKNIVLPGQLQLHMYYHHLLLSIYEPLLETRTYVTPSPQEVVARATKHLQTLIRLYYLRHGFDAMDLFIVIPLMLTGVTCIKSIHEETPASELETLRSTLILISKGLYSQRRNHYLAHVLFRVIQGQMRPQEVALLNETVNLDEDEPEEQKALMQAVRSEWRVNVVRTKEDLDAYMLTNLVDKYAQRNVTGTPTEGKDN